MVNRIDGTPYYEYSKSQNVNLDSKTETSEKFSLDYKKDNISSEDKEKKEKDKAEKAAADAARAAEQGGVKLELSNRGKTSSLEGTKALDTAGKKENAGLASFVDSLQDFVRLAVTAVKDLFYRIWNDPPAKEQNLVQDISADSDEEISEIHTSDSTESENFENTAPVSEGSAAGELSSEELASAMRNETARIDKEVQQYLKSGNLSQVVSLLTNDGKKVAAHNSTLLTYYDRNGRMIELSASDRERILHGERSTIKL